MSEPITSEAAAVHFEKLKLLLEPLFQHSNQLKDSEVVLLTEHIVPVIDFLQSLAPEGISQPRTMIFGRGGQFQVQIQVVDGELQLQLKDCRGDLLIGMQFPREMALNISASILSHKEPEEVPPEKRN